MGVGRGSCPPPPQIFIHGTNIVERGLKVLFSVFFCYFSVFFSVAPPLENFLPTPLPTVPSPVQLKWRNTIKKERGTKIDKILLMKILFMAVKFAQIYQVL